MRKLAVIMVVVIGIATVSIIVAWYNIYELQYNSGNSYFYNRYKFHNLVPPPDELVEDQDYIAICAFRSAREICDLGTFTNDVGDMELGSLIEYELEPIEVIKGDTLKDTVFYWYTTVVDLVGGSSTMMRGYQFGRFFVWGKRIRGPQEIMSAALSIARFDKIDWKLVLDTVALDSSHYAERAARILNKSDSLKRLGVRRNREGVLLYQSTYAYLNAFDDGYATIFNWGEDPDETLKVDEYIARVREAAKREQARDTTD
ncbi:MAG TPA: hypothetical protein VJ983_07575 [candidate division Zixibacteria bacterium]|nr:hypothetical protein [candidate division Zixibacteria bacterium]